MATANNIIEDVLIWREYSESSILKPWLKGLIARVADWLRSLDRHIKPWNPDFTVVEGNHPTATSYAKDRRSYPWLFSRFIEEWRRERNMILRTRIQFDSVRLFIAWLSSGASWPIGCVFEYFFSDFQSLAILFGSQCATILSDVHFFHNAWQFLSLNRPFLILIFRRYKVLLPQGTTGKFPLTSNA